MPEMKDGDLGERRPELAEVSKGAVSGSEVVDRDRTPSALRASSRVAAMPMSTMRAVSVTSSVSAAGSSPLPQEGPVHIVDERVRVELATGDVDGNPDPVSAANASLQPLASLPQQPSVRSGRISLVFGKRDEEIGRDDASVGCRQRMSASTPLTSSLCRLNVRLVDEEDCRASIASRRSISSSR